MQGLKCEYFTYYDVKKTFDQIHFVSIHDLHKNKGITRSVIRKMSRSSKLQNMCSLLLIEVFVCNRV